MGGIRREDNDHTRQREACWVVKNEAWRKAHGESWLKGVRSELPCAAWCGSGVEGERGPSEKYLQHWKFLTFIDVSGDSGIFIECECACVCDLACVSSSVDIKEHDDNIARRSLHPQVSREITKVEHTGLSFQWGRCKKNLFYHPESWE